MEINGHIVRCVVLSDCGEVRFLTERRSKEDRGELEGNRFYQLWNKEIVTSQFTVNYRHSFYTSSVCCYLECKIQNSVCAVLINEKTNHSHTLCCPLLVSRGSASALTEQSRGGRASVGNWFTLICPAYPLGFPWLFFGQGANSDCALFDSLKANSLLSSLFVWQFLMSRILWQFHGTHLPFVESLEPIADCKHLVPLGDAHPDGRTYGGVHARCRCPDVQHCHVEVALKARKSKSDGLIIAAAV